MAYKCANCYKGIEIGSQHTHHPGVAGGRWKKRAPRTQKIFRPNLHVAHIKVEGTSKRVKLCTKCLRTYKASLKTEKESTPQKTTSV